MTKYIDRYYLNWEEYGIKFAGWGGWRQPWANTIAYYPLTNDFNDYSWNGNNLTGYNSATIWTLSGMTCLDLTANSSYISWTVSNIPQGNQARTNMFWVKWNNIWNYPVYWYGSSGSGRWDTVYSNSNITWSQYGGAVYSDVYEDISNRIHVAITTSGNSIVLYVNWAIQKSGSLTVNTNGTTLYLGKNPWDNAYLNWYISQFIIEDKVRTAQEISDYYDQTKSLYWIS